MTYKKNYFPVKLNEEMNKTCKQQQQQAVL